MSCYKTSNKRFLTEPEECQTLKFYRLQTKFLK